MALDKIFNIVSHFKFEVGSGLVALSSLEKKLGAVSEASQGVSNQFKFLFARSALTLTGATGGIVGVIQKAVQATEDFSKAQQKLAQILAGNSKHFVNPIKDFNEGMVISKGLLEGLIKDANKLGVGVDSYLDSFNHLNTILIPKGAAGNNLETSKELAANLLRGSSVLGIHPTDIQWQGGALIEGQAHNRQTLFRRLRTETEAFKGVSPAQFNAKKPKERVDLLNKGLKQFTDSSQLLETHLRSLSGQMTILKNLFSSAGSILKPLGATIRRLLVEGLTHLNKFLEDKLSKAIKIIAKDFDSLYHNLDDVYMSLGKLNSLSKDFKTSGSISNMVFLFIALKGALANIGPILARVSKGFAAVFGAGILSKLGAFGKGVQTVGLAVGASALGMVKKLGLVSRGFRAAGVVLAFVLRSVWAYTKLAVPIFIFLRILERAKLKAKKLDALYIANNVDNYARKLVELRKLYDKFINPLDYIMNQLADLFTWIYSVSARLKVFVKVLQAIGLLEEDFEKLDNGLDKAKKSIHGFAKALITMYAIIETTISLFFNKVLKVIFKPIILFSDVIHMLGKAIGKTIAIVVNAIKSLYFSIREFFTGRKEEKPMFKNFYSDNKDIHPALRKHFTGNSGVTEKREGVSDLFKEKTNGIWDKVKDITGITSLGNIFDEYDKNIDKHLKQYNDKYNRVDKAEKARNIINIGKVEIKNKFRENLEPDRIAIAIRDVLTNAVQAPTGTASRDNTYIGGVGGGFVGG